MITYFASDTIYFFDAVEKIKIGNSGCETITITNDVNHCHLIRFILGAKISIIGVNKPKYLIYLDPKEICSDPKWQFNSTLFFYSNNSDIRFSNLHFTYIIEIYDFISSKPKVEADNTTTEIINLEENQNHNSFTIVLMEFYNSKIDFKDCTFENNTNRVFEIIIQKESLITFHNCTFIGDFIFTLDIDSKRIIQ